MMDAWWNQAVENQASKYIFIEFLRISMHLMQQQLTFWLDDAP
jgi:hypothetical protein